MKLYPIRDSMAIWLLPGVKRVIILPSLFILALLVLSYCNSNSSSDSEKEQSETNQEPTAVELAGMAQMKLYGEWNIPEAKVAIANALAKDDKLASIHADRAWISVLENDKEASMASIIKAQQAEPENPQWVLWQGWICWFYKDYECAENYVGESLEMNPNLRDAQFVMAMMDLERGKKEEAIYWFEQAGTDSTHYFAKAVVHALKGENEQAKAIMATVDKWNNPLQILPLSNASMIMGDKDEAYAWLEKALELHHPLMPWLHVMPPTEPIREEARFQAIVEKIYPNGMPF